MSGKKVAFGTKPAKTATPAADANQWVERRETEPTKRLTLEIPASLHKKIKAKTAMRGTTMIAEITALLEERYGTDGQA